MKNGVLVVGSTTIDENIQDGVTYNKIGGVTTYSSITFQKHGIKTVVITNIAKQDKFIKEFFKNNNILVKSGFSETTTKFININSGDTRIQMMPECALPIAPEQIQNYINDVTVIYLGPLHPDDLSVSVFDIKKPRNLSVCLDIQGYVRRIDNSNKVEKQVSDHLKKALMFSDIVKAEGKELELILNHYQLSLLELTKIFNIREMIVTLGKLGGYVQLHPEKKIDFKSYPASKIVDSTGAGDVFFATYVTSRIFKKMAVSDSCAQSAFIASKHVSGNYFHPELLNIDSM